MKHLFFQNLTAAFSLACLAACTTAPRESYDVAVGRLATEVQASVHNAIRKVEANTIDGADSPGCEKFKQLMPTYYVGDQTGMYAKACAVRSQVDIHSHFAAEFKTCTTLDNASNITQIATCLKGARAYVDSGDLPVDVEKFNNFQRRVSRLGAGLIAVR
jgi:hypothetical protein